ncbi:hypothetical protein PHLCEN_2v5563 [Hermanssonia centrifuga]|uniref:Uncharacterized protein n=1 Tax=Hermanssonia centrifuga TaxID=98765 RepID=A0A2R6P236_9APHY|nr:hypothetical protein PHLCEN_2v5563 [Hermanssonia centrifuga]
MLPILVENNNIASLVLHKIRWDSSIPSASINSLQRREQLLCLRILLPAMTKLTAKDSLSQEDTGKAIPVNSPTAARSTQREPWVGSCDALYLCANLSPDAVLYNPYPVPETTNVVMCGDGRSAYTLNSFFEIFVLKRGWSVVSDRGRQNNKVSAKPGHRPGSDNTPGCSCVIF